MTDLAGTQPDTAELLAKIAERRQDAGFMARLACLVETEAPVLDRLTDQPDTPPARVRCEHHREETGICGLHNVIDCEREPCCFCAGETPTYADLERRANQTTRAEHESAARRALGDDAVWCPQGRVWHHRDNGCRHDKHEPVPDTRCPRCNSPAPNLHPAIQHEGEVQPCPDPWHGQPDTRESAPGAVEIIRQALLARYPGASTFGRAAIHGDANVIAKALTAARLLLTEPAEEEWRWVRRSVLEDPRLLPLYVETTESTARGMAVEHGGHVERRRFGLWERVQ